MHWGERERVKHAGGKKGIVGNGKRAREREPWQVLTESRATRIVGVYRGSCRPGGRKIVNPKIKVRSRR